MRDVVQLVRNLDPAWQAASGALLLAIVVIAVGAVVAWLPYLNPPRRNADAD